MDMTNCFLIFRQECILNLGKMQLKIVQNLVKIQLKFGKNTHSRTQAGFRQRKPCRDLKRCRDLKGIRGGSGKKIFPVGGDKSRV